jgi:hypothetical protein
MFDHYAQSARIEPAFDSEPLAEASQVGGTVIRLEHDNGVIRRSGAVGSAREVATRTAGVTEKVVARGGWNLPGHPDRNPWARVVLQAQSMPSGDGRDQTSGPEVLHVRTCRCVQHRLLERRARG